MANLERVCWNFVRVLVWACVAFLDCLLLGESVAWAEEDFSSAETQLFMQAHFQKLKLPSELSYQFSKSGQLEPGFQDKVWLVVKGKNKGACCETQVRFLTGERRLELPDIEAAKGNPVILYFLERDIREMQRRTKGQSHYFRTRIRKALYQTALERAVTLRYKGRSVSGLEYEITPYQDDPLRTRFGLWADKHYVFTLSNAVPGGVAAIRTWVKSPGQTNTVSQETLLLEGASL